MIAFSDFPPFSGDALVVQALETEAARLVARKERERLKLQDKLRKEQIEKMRQQLNTDAAAGDVSGAAISACLHHSACQLERGRSTPP